VEHLAFAGVEALERVGELFVVDHRRELGARLGSGRLPGK
jgi:hypothetical protein